MGASGYLIYGKLQQTSNDPEEANNVLDLTEARNDMPAFELQPMSPDAETAVSGAPRSEPLSTEPSGELPATTTDVPSDQAPPLPPTPESVPGPAALRQLILGINGVDRRMRLRAGQQVADLVRGSNTGPLLGALIREIGLPRPDVSPPPVV